MDFYAFKVSDPGSVELVNSINEGSQDFEIEQINQYESNLKIGDKVFVQLGGDKVPWSKGLVGLAEIIRPPYDHGYNMVNGKDKRECFRLRLKMLITLPKPLAREEFRYYKSAYNAAGIGPNTKGEQNQAIKALTEEQAYSVLRGIARCNEFAENLVKSIFPDKQDEIFGKMPCLIESNVDFDSEKLMINANENGHTCTVQESFKNWALLQKSSKGNNYSEGTINNYCQALKSILVKWGLEETVGISSLFSITDLKSFVAVKNTIKNIPNFSELNESWAKNTPSAAMELYERFLGYTSLPKPIAPYNRIIFGAPGTGKSFTIEQDRDTCFKDNYERVTFHPDYTYANFVGAYKPVSIGDEIKYEYVAGPFMRVLVNALSDVYSDYLLIIEEINRANVAAVFGDVFQLLDRNAEHVSEYAITTSKDMRDYLMKELNCTEEAVKEIKIPSNMYIWATMNSADQGVFPMDTAFKRRWNFEYKDIDDGEDGMKEKNFEITYGGSKKTINWNKLRHVINNKLTDMGVNEDKLLGPYFIAKSVMDGDNEGFVESFKNKVLMYLYEDAAKHKRDRIFANDINGESNKRYSQILKNFNNHGLAIFAGNSFEEAIVNNEPEVPAEGTEE